MDKIKFEFFEFFGAILPGIPVFIISCFWISKMKFSFEAMTSFLKSMSVAEAAIVLLICYCIGFCLHYPAYELFQPLMKKWGIKRTRGYPISIGKREKELSTIRQYSPENFKLINKFLALRQMSYTLFFALLFFCISITISAIYFGDWSRDITAALLFSIIFGFLFLRRSVDFHQRIQDMITETFSILQKSN